MSEDPRCCGSGTCIIDPEGRCWCGQQWDGEKMAAPPLQPRDSSDAPATADNRGAPPSVPFLGGPAQRRR